MFYLRAVVLKLHAVDLDIVSALHVKQKFFDVLGLVVIQIVPKIFVTLNDAALFGDFLLGLVLVQYYCLYHRFVRANID